MSAPGVGMTHAGASSVLDAHTVDRIAPVREAQPAESPGLECIGRAGRQTANGRSLRAGEHGRRPCTGHAAFTESGVAQFVAEGLAKSLNRDQQLASGALIDLADGGLRQRLRRSTSWKVPGIHWM